MFSFGGSIDGAQAFIDELEESAFDLDKEAGKVFVAQRLKTAGGQIRVLKIH